MLSKIFKALFLGVIIIGVGYAIVSFQYTNKSTAYLNIPDYWFYNRVAVYLLVILLVIGGHILYKSLENKNMRYYILTVLIVLYGFSYFYRPIQVTIFLANFSHHPRSVVVENTKYELQPSERRKLIFLRHHIKVDNETINRQGCYVVNLSYEDKILKHGMSTEFSFGVKVNLPLPYSDEKITELDSNPKCSSKELFKDGVSVESSHYFYGTNKK